MTDTTDQQAVTVEQIDVDAAAALDGALGFLTDRERPIVEQAFARHRLASVSSASAEGFSLDARADDPFMTAWCDMEAKGFAYGDEELEHVHLGWLMARGHLTASPEPVPATNQAGEVANLRQALRNIAEGNLGDAPWQANYARIKEVATAALATQPATSQDAIEAGKVVLEGRGDGTYAEAEQAIRGLIAHIEKPATSQEGEGTFACPICGKDTPHYHAPEKSVEPIQCPECGVGRPGHESGCSRATVLTIRPRGPFVSTQPATSQERDDADRANGVGQDELVAGLKRALQHPAGDHDGWTDAGMEDAFFRWPVIVNALNEALLATQPATSQEGCKTCGGNRIINYAESTCQPAHTGPCPSCVGMTIATLPVQPLAATPTPPTLSEDLREVKRTFREGDVLVPIDPPTNFHSSGEVVVVAGFNGAGGSKPDWVRIKGKPGHYGQESFRKATADEISAALAQVKAS